MLFRKPLCVFCAALMAGAVVAEPAVLTLADPVPLSIEEAPSVFQQCSRMTPDHDEGEYWLPSRAEIADLEAALTDNFTTNPDAIAGLLDRDDPMSGQYVGFMRGPKKYIYASYAPVSVYSYVEDGSALIVCDGGYSFWGIVYDPETQTFSEFAANGHA